MTTPDHAAIRARLDAATEGPWEVDDRTSALPRVYSIDPDVDTPPMIAEVHGIHDAALIAHAPTDLAALLAENQRLRDTIQAVNGASSGVPLTWVDDQRGYQCPDCSLYVAIPRRKWATCPRCLGRPVEEVAEILLAQEGFDEDDRMNALEALRPLVNGLVAAALGVSGE